MLRVPLLYAKPNMTLALPVPNPGRTDRFLLHAGFQLDTRSIGRLNDFGVRECWVQHPSLNDMDTMIDHRTLEKHSAVTRHIEQAFSSVQNRTNAQLDYNEYCRSITSLVHSLLSNPLAIMMLNELGDKNQTLMTHCSNVAYLTLLMGLKLDGYLIRQRKRLTHRHAIEIGTLGVGAMLHDLGMLLIDQAAAETARETDDQTDPNWQEHVKLGYQLVHGKVEPSSAVVVLHHHQHYDGSGFPKCQTDDSIWAGRAGNKIHVFARIAAVADTFDTLQHPPAGEKRTTVQVLGMMLRPPLINWFDPVVMRTFLQVLPVYPPGSLLQLSDDRWAVAIKHAPDDPCRPKVQIISSLDELAESEDNAQALALCRDNATPSDDDPHNDATDDVEILDLRDHPDLHVTTVGADQVADFNFPPPQLTNPDVPSPLTSGA